MAMFFSHIIWLNPIRYQPLLIQRLNKVLLLMVNDEVIPIVDRYHLNSIRVIQNFWTI